MEPERTTIATTIRGLILAHKARQRRRAKVRAAAEAASRRRHPTSRSETPE